MKSEDLTLVPLRHSASRVMVEREDHGLPEGLRKPTPITSWQSCLFKKPLLAALAELHVSVDDLAKWYAKDWLSFNGRQITEVDEFDDPRIWELTVIRDIVRAGLNDAQVEHLIRQLPKPCAVSPDRLAYSFRYGWIEIIAPTKPDTDAIIEENIDDWLDSCGQEYLYELRDRIDELLEQDEQGLAEHTE